MWSTWVYRVVHNPCIMHGKDIKTQYIGSTSILLLRKDWNFYQTRSNAIILQETLPSYCIPKVVRMGTGEVIHEKENMSPRPPPKISLKHDWTRELDSEHAQWSEVGQLSRSFQSNQPILNPSRERTVRPVIETSVIQARSSEDNKDPHVETAHERTRRLVTEINTENVPDSSQTRSFFMKAKHSTLRQSTSWKNGETRRKPWRIRSRANNAERGEHGLPNSRITTFCCEALAKYQRSRIDSENWEPPRSTRRKWATSNCLNCSRRILKRRTACISFWNVGIVYCTCGHFLQKETEANRKFVKYTMDLLSIPNYVIKKGRPHGHRQNIIWLTN